MRRDETGLDNRQSFTTNLVIDIGNTNAKVALFRDREIISLHKGPEVDETIIRDWVARYQPVAAIISTVRKPDGMEWLASAGFPVLFAGTNLKLPVRLCYKTPETLGSDRLAAAIAATDKFPGQTTLVINAGSCITTDLVLEGKKYLGGTIAPGLHMRLHAMHYFTGKLPLLNQVDPEIPLIGDSTESSMMSGVINGMAAELEGLITRLEKEIGFFNVILSGGDGKIFAKKLKNRIFAVDNIVLHGLNLMLKHNV